MDKNKHWALATNFLNVNNESLIGYYWAIDKAVAEHRLCMRKILVLANSIGNYFQILLLNSLNISSELWRGSLIVEPVFINCKNRFSMGFQIGETIVKP